MQGKYILDVACRDGFVTRRFLQDDCEIMGFDICHDAIDKAKEIARGKYPKNKHHYYDLSIQHFPWEVNKGLFDMVICFEFIEHIPGEDVVWLLGKISESLNEGGYAAISTPHIDGKYGENGDDETHINLYDEERLELQILVTTGHQATVTRDGEFIYAYWKNVKNEEK